jgi:hypothetical protein
MLRKNHIEVSRESLVFRSGWNNELKEAQMYRKLGIGVTALTINLCGLAFLAAPARAAIAGACSSNESAYAQGYADGACGGMNRGHVTSCSSDANGNITFQYYCLES